MKIQSLRHFLFPQRKNALFVLFFAFVSLSFAMPVHAAAIGTDMVSSALRGFAIGILDLEAILANVAAGLFAWMLEPTAFLSVMNNAVLYEIWKIVRDTMNMVFILVLLFSAFATIYQVDKYKYNKILWTVILMALLTNFSWPISRTIIDFFNSMMYFFVQSVFHTTGTDAAKGFLTNTNMTSVFLPQGDASEWSQIFLAMAMMLVFAVTLVMLSFLMLVRFISLPVLVMFSPIGFAGMAAPFTQSYAKKWWSKLIDYASFGPIAVFMVLVSMRVLENMQALKGDQGNVIQGMSANTGAVSNDILSTVAFFLIPIILFWSAIKYAEKASKDISGISLDFGSKFLSKMGKLPWRGTKAIVGGVATGLGSATGITARKEGVKRAWKERRGFYGADYKREQEEITNKTAASILGGAAGKQNAIHDAFDKRVKAEQEALQKFGNVSQALSMLSSASSSPEKKKAAAVYLSDKEALVEAKNFNAALSAVGEDLAAARGIISKAPKTVLTNTAELLETLQTLKTNGHQKLFADVIGKTEKKALGSTGAEYDTIRDTLKIMTKDEHGKDTATPNDVATEDLRKAYKKRIAEQGQMHIIVESIANEDDGTGNGTKKTERVAFEEAFKGIRTEDVANQDDDKVLKKADFIAYLKSRDKQYRKEVLASIGRRGKGDVATYLTTKGVSPTALPTP